MRVRFALLSRLSSHLITSAACAAHVLALVLCNSAALAAQARANDAVSLEQPDQQIDKQPHNEQVRDSSQIEAVAASDPAERHFPPRETQPLGEPRSLFGGAKGFGRSNDDLPEAAGQPAEPTDQRTMLSTFDGETGHFVQVIAALLFVIGLILLTRFILMRSTGMLSGGRPSGVLEILARYPVARGQSLILIKMARRIVLVHQSGSGMTTLSEVSDQDEVASLLSRIEAGARGREQHRFRNLLEQFQREHQRIDRRDPSHMAAEHEAEIVDLTRRQSGGWHWFFGGAR